VKRLLLPTKTFLRLARQREKDLRERLSQLEQELRRLRGAGAPPTEAK
jgi:hypothetical protein